MKGQMEIGFISATHLFGISGGRIMGGFIALMLISSVSSMAFVGPRVSQTMGEDIHILKFLSFKSGNNIPVPAILLQYAISVIMILSAGFEQVMKYSGFTLNLFTFMTVLGLFVHRIRFRNDERPYRTWGFPVVPLIFLLLIGWTLYFLMIYSTRESLIGLATVLSGLVFYFLNDFVVKRKKKHASVSENTKV